MRRLAPAAEVLSEGLTTVVRAYALDRRNGVDRGVPSPADGWSVDDRRELTRLLAVVPRELVGSYEASAGELPVAERQSVAIAAAFVETALALQQLPGRAPKPLELLVADSLLAHAASLLVERSPRIQIGFATVIQRCSAATAAGDGEVPVRDWLVDAMRGAVGSASKPRSLPAPIDEEIRSRMHGDPPAVADPMARLVGAGGKRLRSRLALAAADVGPTPRPGLAVQYAAALEILHSASLAHDDYIDASPLRRNAPTIAALEGAERAVTVGHYYFGKALQAVIELEQRNVLATVAAALRAICRSQTDELFRRGRASGWTSYVRIAHGKTGALFAAASAGGAELSGTRRPLVARLRSYGDLIGVAFQITDDLIDFSDATGKPVGQDIRTGTLSLPIRYALEDEVVGPELRAILGRPLDDEATVERVIVAVTATDAIARAREHAERLVERALGILSTRDLDRARPALVHLARMAVDRAA